MTGKSKGLGGSNPPRSTSQAAPPAVDRPALIKDVRSVNSNAIFDRLPLYVTALEVVEHRMIRPLDSVVWIVSIEKSHCAAP